MLDTGIDTEHPDLADRIDRDASASFTLGSDLTDRHGHGTHVAGLIAGTGTVDVSLRGVAPGADLIIIKIASASGAGIGDDLAKGVLHAIERDADIINYSGATRAWVKAGGPPPWKWAKEPNISDQAFLLAMEKGVLCVAAAGNGGPNSASVERPGNLEPILCAGAVDRTGAVAVGSARGPVYVDPALPKNAVVARADLALDQIEPESYLKPDIVVPGGDFLPHSPLQAPLRPVQQVGIMPGGLVSCRSSHSEHLPLVKPDDPDYPYTRLGGTSQATALVSGLAALILEYARKLDIDWGGRNSASCLKRLFCHAAARMDVGDSRDFGHGKLIWPRVVGELEDCAENDEFRKRVFDGAQLTILE